MTTRNGIYLNLRSNSGQTVPLFLETGSKGIGAQELTWYYRGSPDYIKEPCSQSSSVCPVEAFNPTSGSTLTPGIVDTSGSHPTLQCKVVAIAEQ